MPNWDFKKCQTPWYKYIKLESSRISLNFTYDFAFIVLGQRLSSPNLLVVDSCGRSGDLILFWKEDLQVDVRSYSRGHIDVVVVLKIVWNLPRCCVGEFNKLFAYEKNIGSSERNRPSMIDFRRCLEDYEFHDLPYSGDRFMWKNGQGRTLNIRGRLDKVVADVPWMDLFLDFDVRHKDLWGWSIGLCNSSLKVNRGPDPLVLAVSGWKCGG